LLLDKVPDADIVLTKGVGGIFDIVVDGRKAYSKGATGRFPTDAEVTACV
jgi:predicted Rdx family selenoprotein